MNSNLANVYANLLRKYGDNYIVTYTAAPTYLNNIVGATENPGKIILFYVEDRSIGITAQFVSPSKLNKKKSNNVDMDLTGSPLKDDCELDTLDDMSLDLNLISSNFWKPEEEYHKGISLDKARAIITSEDFQISESASGAVGSVWFLCSGIDALKTQLLQYEFGGNQCTRGIITYRGIIASHAVISHSLLQEHRNLVGKDVCVETQIENTYNIKSNISIKCCWSTVSVKPSLIDLRTCDVNLKQTFRLTDITSSTQDFVNQIRILIALREEIICYKQMQNSDAGREPTYLCGIGIDMVELRENIYKIVTEISEIDTSSGAELDIEDVIQNVKIRRLNDLTDKLWDIFKRNYV